MNDKIHHTAIIPESLSGKRLDQALASLFPEYSRSKLQEWLKSGQLLVNGATLKPKTVVSGGEEVIVNATLAPQENWRPQNISLEVVYEDEALMVINKPAGLVVHPAAGNPDNTLVNALLHYAPELASLPRAGLIHRLDKDTSGLLVIARSLPAHTKLVAALQARAIKREYQAVVHGVMTGGGTVEAPIGRHPKNRLKMAVVAGGKPAITHYSVLNRYAKHTHLKIILETGRTHQIRVHMAHIHYPIVGDRLYGRRGEQASIKRQALHAVCLGLYHPISGEYLEWHSGIPAGIQQVLAAVVE